MINFNWIEIAIFVIFRLPLVLVYDYQKMSHRKWCHAHAQQCCIIVLDNGTGILDIKSFWIHVSIAYAYIFTGPNEKRYFSLYPGTCDLIIRDQTVVKISISRHVCVSAITKHLTEKVYIGINLRISTNTMEHGMIPFSVMDSTLFKTNCNLLTWIII